MRYDRSVPTHDDIMVPETLLKKRKSQEKAREERSAELQKKKKVGVESYIKKGNCSDGDDIYHTCD